MGDDTPRSYASPRDDRFFTPRTIARSNSASNSDEWISPRDYQTPRTYYDTDRKDSARLPLSQRSNGSKDYDAKQMYANGYDGYYQQQSQPKRPPTASAPPKPQKFEEDDYDQQPPSHISEQDVEDIFSFTRHGRLEEIERLLNKGVPVDIRDLYGNTILITACQNGNKRVAKAALRRGANINARNYRGNTPLHYCYHCESSAALRCLFSVSLLPHFLFPFFSSFFLLKLFLFQYCLEHLVVALPFSFTSSDSQRDALQMAMERRSAST